jgi:hypothetical protein
MHEDLTLLDDMELTERVAAGDQAAIGVLYDRYATPAFSLALRLAGDPQRAADLVQRAFTRVWTDAQRFDPARGRFATWLLTLVNYLALASPSPLSSPASAKTGTGPLRLAPAPVPITRCR